MAKNCVFVPARGAQTFKNLRKNFGYQVAAEVFSRISGPDFIRVFNDTVELDDTGIPTYESIMKLPIVQEHIGQQRMIEYYQKQQPVMDDSLQATDILIKAAKQFNDTHKGYVGYVDYNNEGKLTIVIGTATEQNIQSAMYQEKIQALNSKIAELLGNVGITMDMLSSYQTSLGRVGLTEFQRVKDIADGFTATLSVANNKEGFHAVSEEFAHFVIGVYRNNPLVQRSIAYLMNHQDEVKDILGGHYDMVYSYYGGDEEMMAEEAAGHLFQRALINNQNQEIEQKPLFKRMISSILNFFRELSPSFFRTSVDTIIKDYSELAQNILKEKKTIQKEDIQKAKRIASFNALSEKGKIQIETLKKIMERDFKAAALQDNLEEPDEHSASEKSKARQFAEKVKTTITKYGNKEETMAAIAAYLTLAQQNITQQMHDMQDLEGKTVRDKFTVLRNTLTVIQKYGETIEELETITNDEFASDEGIMSQNFMLDDPENSLADYEAADEVEPLDTEGMSAEEISNLIQEEANNYQLIEEEDDSYYVDSRTNEKQMRVTKTIEADIEGDEFDKNSPWIKPSTNIGTGIDEFTRDFLADRMKLEADGTYTINGKKLSEVYPNVREEDIQAFAKQLTEFKQKLTDQGITLIPRDVIANGTIETVDGAGRIHKVNVAGTIDLLGYDKDGNWHLFDMKTHRSKNIDDHKKAKWSRQLTLYKKFLEQKYGITVNDMQIIPIKVEYPTPKGYGNGTAIYTTNDDFSKPEDYNGLHNNQLILNGSEYKDANPKLENLILIDTANLDIQYSVLANDPTNGLGGGAELVKHAVHTTREMYKKLKDDFSETIMPQFLQFLSPFVGENIKVADPKNAGKFKVVSIESILKESKDTTIMQAWLSSMADNPDAFMQIMDHVVKKQRDIQRQKTIEASQRILALGKKYEKLGIKSYDWMYEEDNREYINKLYDRTAYNKAMKEEWARLDALYGERPVIGTDAYRAKKKAREQWLLDNTVPSNKEHDSMTHPDPTKYPSKYSRLSEAQKRFYDEWMALKTELDSYLGPNKTHLTNTIKIRKSNIERVKASLKGGAIEEFVEEMKSNVMKSFDDTMVYSKNVKGIKGFDGREVMKLPLYYINMPKNSNTNDLSRDAIGTLVAYADMVFNYDAMNEVVNPLEIGREIARRRKIKATRGDKAVKEVFRYAGRTVENDIYIDTNASNFMKELDSFFESKIYGRFLVDQGDIRGTKIDANKAAGILLKLGSSVQLGFNLLANFANIGTGIAMQNIEAAAGEFFKARELAKADKEFSKEMPEFLSTLGNRIKTSKLDLFDEMFDVKQNYRTKVKHKDFTNRNWLTRLFGPGIQYIGQEAGDHWLYNRTAIAIALNYKLKLGNKEISLWDALETQYINENDHSLGKKLVFKQGIADKNGVPLSDQKKLDIISEVSGRMRYVNQHLFGIYNEDDAIMARRHILGRFAMQYRDWMPTQFRYRFGAATTNLEKGQDEVVEGYYRTSGRFLKQLYNEALRGEKTLGQVWDNLEPYEVKNIKRSIAEVSQFTALCLLLALIGGGGDDKESPWALRTLKYFLIREKTELGVLSPISPTSLPFFGMVKEGIKITKSPFAATNVLDDITGLQSLLWVPNYFDTIERGDFRGHSSAYKAFIQSPLSLWYRTILRTTNPEKAANYFDD